MRLASPPTAGRTGADVAVGIRGEHSVPSSRGRARAARIDRATALHRCQVWRFFVSSLAPSFGWCCAARRRLRASPEQIKDVPWVLSLLPQFQPIRPPSPRVPDDPSFWRVTLLRRAHFVPWRARHTKHLWGHAHHNGACARRAPRTPTNFVFRAPLDQPPSNPISHASRRCRPPEQVSNGDAQTHCFMRYGDQMHTLRRCNSPKCAIRPPSCLRRTSKCSDLRGFCCMTAILRLYVTPWCLVALGSSRGSARGARRRPNFTSHVHVLGIFSNCVRACPSLAPCLSTVWPCRLWKLASIGELLGNI